MQRRGQFVTQVTTVAPKGLTIKAALRWKGDRTRRVPRRLRGRRDGAALGFAAPKPAAPRRGDGAAVTIDPRIKPADESDWDTEYLDACLSVKVVKGLEEGINHVAAHSSAHTDAIVTEDMDAAGCFLSMIDSAVVMHNASTQFSDGGEFGMGAEIGIATGKMHARGPVGLEQLTSFKYLVHGEGQTRP